MMRILSLALLARHAVRQRLRLGSGSEDSSAGIRSAGCRGQAADRPWSPADASGECRASINI